MAALAADVSLILDEPTSGLDPLMEAVFVTRSPRRRNGAGPSRCRATASEVEALADRVSIIRQGRVVVTGLLDALRGRPASGSPPRRFACPPTWELTMLHDARLDGERVGSPHRRPGPGQRRDG